MTYVLQIVSIQGLNRSHVAQLNWHQVKSGKLLANRCALNYITNISRRRKRSHHLVMVGIHHQHRI